MNILNSKLYAFLETLSNIFILNLLWIVLCIPIVTIFPATSAMFSVVRRWKLREDNSVFDLFFRYFKMNFKQSLLIGIIWLIFSLVLYLDYFLMLQVESEFKVYLLVPLFFIGLLFLFTSVLLFPVMSHYKVSWKNIIKNSFLMSIAYFPMTLLNLIVLTVLVITLLYFPIICLLVFSFGAYVNFSLCNWIFQKIDRLKEKEKKVDNI